MDERPTVRPAAPPLFARLPTKCFLACRIRLTEGKVAIVDPEDWVVLNRKVWRAKLGRGGWYAQAKIRRNGRTRYIYMHRLIANTPRDKHCHHKNGNGLDDRRLNLQNRDPGEHEQYHRMLRIARKSA